MNMLRRGLVALVMLLVSSTLLAECPPVNNYRLSAHNANHTQCTYVASNPILGALQNPKLCLKAFILTDPHFKIVNCKYSQEARRCVCTIIRK